MRGVSRWLAGARAEGGLLVPGHPARRTCDLLLTSADVQVRADGEVASLAYDDWAGDLLVGDPGNVSLRDPTGDSWRLDRWAYSNDNSIGAAAIVSGACITATDAVRAKRTTLWSRFERLMESGTAVPLFTEQFSGRGEVADIGTLSQLCGMLRRHPERRVRLDDRERVERLASDLTARRYGVVRQRTGIRRSTLVILNAMRALGHQHEAGGRPIPGVPVPTVEELVPGVLERVRSDPYAVGVDADADDVRGVLEHFYTGVEPWPFAALTAP